MSTMKKQSLYFPAEILEEMQQEAIRQDRSLSWIAQRAWKLAQKTIEDLPAMANYADDKDA